MVATQQRNTHTYKLIKRNKRKITSLFRLTSVLLINVCAITFAYDEHITHTYIYRICCMIVPRNENQTDVAYYQSVFRCFRFV